jgi:hypothetical protein
MAAGIETQLCSMEDVVVMIDEKKQRNAQNLADWLVAQL